MLLIGGLVGELFIDGFLPTMFSGVLVAGDSLLQASLSTFLVPMVAFLFLVLYLVLVYCPARKAKNKRLEIKKYYWDQNDVKGPPIISKRAKKEKFFLASLKKVSNNR
jgi:membrane protein implicated in regulation of membrane protease activity